MVTFYYARPGFDNVKGPNHSHTLSIMAKISCDDSLFQALSGKVVVLTGGATGIGRSTVQQFCGRWSPMWHILMRTTCH
jgi:hypothetical protein